MAFSVHDQIEFGRVDLKEGEYIHGALTHLGVYAVTIEGRPRVVL